MIKKNRDLLNRLNILTDAVLLFAAMTISFFFRSLFFEKDSFYIGFEVYARLSVLLIPASLLIYYFFGLYRTSRGQSFGNELRKIIESNALVCLLLIGGLFVFKLTDISRWVIVIFYVCGTALVAVKHYAVIKVLRSLRKRGRNLRHIVIAGNGAGARAYLNAINRNSQLGYVCDGYLGEEAKLEITHLGSLSDTESVLASLKPDELVCGLENDGDKALKTIIDACEKTGTRISIIPECYKYIPRSAEVDQIDGVPLLNIRKIPLDNIGNAFIKRLSDIIMSLFFIVLFSPLMLITAIIIPLTSKGPVLFKQTRVGFNKKEFTMYKFRSMCVSSSVDGEWTSKNDCRRTRFGSFIRKLSIDELPQFFNVLKGDMSIVGPRPELPCFVNSFSKDIPLYMIKHQVKPGMTGLAQIKGFRGDTSVAKRIQYDISYIENWSVWLDILIILRTVFGRFINNEQM